VGGEEDQEEGVGVSDVYMYIYTAKGESTKECEFVKYVCMYVCIYAWQKERAQKSASLLDMYVCMYIYICMYVYIHCIYICKYVYIHC